MFHNWLTGKLSDFAGLFAFSLFFGALLPRWKGAIYLCTTLGFVIWKSTFSQAMIDLVNMVLPIKVGRTVDWTDIAFDSRRLSTTASLAFLVMRKSFLRNSRLPSWKDYVRPIEFGSREFRKFGGQPQI